MAEVTLIFIEYMLNMKMFSRDNERRQTYHLKFAFLLFNFTTCNFTALVVRDIKDVKVTQEYSILLDRTSRGCSLLHLFSLF